jgi:hypothetical protein
MDFSIFYDSRPQTACNVNASLPGDPPTGQMYGGYYVDQGPAGYHNEEPPGGGTRHAIRPVAEADACRGRQQLPHEVCGRDPGGCGSGRPAGP